MAPKKKLQHVKCAGTMTFRVNESGGVEFLLVRSRKDGRWGPPKGHCEPGETIEEAAVRETYEETGIVARLLYELPPIFGSTPKETKTVHCFMARQLNEGTTPRPQEGEVVEVGWFPIDALPEIHLYQRPLLKYAINAIKRNLQ